MCRASPDCCDSVVGEDGTAGGTVGALVVVYVASVLVAVLVGNHRGRAGAGLLLGLLLSWLGAGLALFLQPASDAPSRRPCPFCAEPILPAAKLCPHCHSEIPLSRKFGPWRDDE
jgi:hypothetical protein